MRKTKKLSPKRSSTTSKMLPPIFPTANIRKNTRTPTIIAIIIWDYKRLVNFYDLRLEEAIATLLLCILLPNAWLGMQPHKNDG